MPIEGCAELSEEEAGRSPYPVVYVLPDGSYRECQESEKAYLETPFHPADGARPYVKESYSSLTPDGKISGFLYRYQLPAKARFTA